MFFGTIDSSKFSFFVFFRKLKRLSEAFCLERVPLQFFATNWIFKKPRGSPPFTGLKTLRFLSLRYSADFKHSRLGNPVNFPLIYAKAISDMLTFHSNSCVRRCRRMPPVTAQELRPRLDKK